MSQQYPQGPNQTQNPPPQVVYVERKTHKFRNFVVLPFVGLIALIVIIAVASSGGGGSDPAAAGTVTNVSKSTSTAVFSIKFLKGSQVVGNLQCTGNELEAGQQEAVECLNTVDGAANLLRKGAYDKVF